MFYDNYTTYVISLIGFFYQSVRICIMGNKLSGYLNL